MSTEAKTFLSLQGLTSYDGKLKEWVNTQVAAARAAIEIKKELVTTLPAVGDPNTLYLMPTSKEFNENQAEDIYDEYIYLSGNEPGGPDAHYELIGNTRVDLTNYVTNDILHDFVRIDDFDDYTDNVKAYADTQATTAENNAKAYADALFVEITEAQINALFA